MKAGTQCSSNRRSKMEAQLKRKPQQMIAKSLIPDFNSVDQEFKEEEKIVSKTDFNSAEQEISEVQNSPDSTATWGVTPESEEKFQDIHGSTISSLDSSVTIFDPPPPPTTKMSDGEAQLVIEFLREARLKISDAANVDRRSKKIIDAVIDIVTEDCCRVPETETGSSELVFLKVRIGVLCFIWIVFVAVLLFYKFGGETHLTESLPT